MTTEQPTDGPAALGQALRRERRRGKQKQAAAARHFGISQPSYSRWENGLARPDDGRLQDVARYLGMELSAVWKLVHNGREPFTLESVMGLVGELEDVVGRLSAALNDLSTAAEGGRSSG